MTDDQARLEALGEWDFVLVDPKDGAEVFRMNAADLAARYAELRTEYGPRGAALLAGVLFAVGTVFDDDAELSACVARVGQSLEGARLVELMRAILAAEVKA